MPLLSFSVKEEELKSGRKIRTTRLFTPEKWRQWQRCLPDGDRVLYGWWKPRTKEKYLIFVRKGQDLYRIRFIMLNGRAWPCKEVAPMYGTFVKMRYYEAEQWAREEGFENNISDLSSFFERNYDLSENPIFQSIAFPGDPL